MFGVIEGIGLGLFWVLLLDVGGWLPEMFRWPMLIGSLVFMAVGVIGGKGRKIDSTTYRIWRLPSATGSTRPTDTASG